MVSLECLVVTVFGLVVYFLGFLRFLLDIRRFPWKVVVFCWFLSVFCWLVPVGTLVAAWCVSMVSLLGYNGVLLWFDGFPFLACWLTTMVIALAWLACVFGLCLWLCWLVSLAWLACAFGLVGLSLWFCLLVRLVCWWKSVLRFWCSWFVCAQPAPGCQPICVSLIYAARDGPNLFDARSVTFCIVSWVSYLVRVLLTFSGMKLEYQDVLTLTRLGRSLPWNLWSYCARCCLILVLVCTRLS